MTLKLVFLVALIAFCFSLSDAREMPKEEGDCIGKCPPDNPNCNYTPLPLTPPSTDDAREVSKESVVPSQPGYGPPPPPLDDGTKTSKETMMPKTCIGICPPNDPGCRCMPLETTPPPLGDAKEMSKEVRPPPCYATPPPPPMDDARVIFKEAMPPPYYVSPPPPPKDDVREMSKETMMPPPCYASPPPPMMQKN